MESKKWYQSKTIWGVVIALIGFLLSKFLGVPDLEIPENADLETIQKHIDAFKAAQGNIMNIISEAMAAFGSLLAIIGRINAEGKLTK